MKPADILQKIKEWFGIKRSPELWYSMDRTNMRVGLYSSLVIFVFELYMIWNMFGYAEKHVSEELRQEWLMGHGICYGMMVFMSGAMIIYAIAFLRNMYIEHGTTVFLTSLYSIVIAGFGMYISYNDYKKGEAVIIFLAMMAAVAGIYVMNPIFATIYFLTNFIAFYVMISNVNPVSTAMRVNYISFMALIFIVTLSRYNEARFTAKNQNAYKNLSCYDPLTGAKNLRTLNNERMNYVDREVFVLVSDVDDFKFINDRFGHEAGDKAMAELVKAANDLPCSEGCGKEIYRINGDQVVVFLTDTHKDDVVKYGEALADAAKRIEHAGYTLYLTISTGIVYGVPKDPEDCEKIMHYADRMMYDAKKEGGARIKVEDFLILKEDDDGYGLNNIYDKEDADPLTGLPNMMRFRDRAQKLMVSMNMYYQPYAFVFFDIVNFKSYNEKYGFQNGDLMIKSFATSLMDAFEGNLISRFNGDQFVAVAPMDHLIDKIETVHHSLHSMQQHSHLEVKAGIYQPSEGETNVSVACDRAKIVCDSIKHNYELKYKYYDDSMMRELKKKQYIVDTIDEAIENGYIQVYYQPVCRAVSGELCGMEVLARWNDPRFGFLQPNEFIDALEQNRLIYKIDRFMVRKACSDLNKMRKDGFEIVPISFNVSRVDFELCDMIGIVEESTKEFKIDKKMIHIEITETALMDNADYLSHEIKRFHDAGYQVWMDDFGSGYSSLNTLQEYHFDVLKIDMIFLKNYGTSAKSREILASVVDMCKKIGIHTLAEGVETQEQLDFLRSIGCEKVQGYFFDKPLPITDLRSNLESGKFKCESRESATYFEKIGRVNMLSQAPMEYFHRFDREDDDTSEIFSGKPLAIAETIDNMYFHYLCANDKYIDVVTRLTGHDLTKSSNNINDLSENFKEAFRRSIIESMHSGHIARTEFDIEGLHYTVKVKYITSMKDRHAVLLAIDGAEEEELIV